MKNFRKIINCIIKLVSILIPLIISCFVFYNQVQIRPYINESKKNIISAIEKLENPEIDIENIKEDLVAGIDKVINNDMNAYMEVLVGIFGIIISVWVGLNIYNVMKKDDYDNLLETITEKCAEHDMIQKKVENTYFENMELHISYLYKTFDVNNNSSQYFYSMFKSIDIKQLSYKFLLNAIFLETVYVKLTAIHDRNEHYKMEPHLEEGFMRCKEMFEWIANDGDKIQHRDKLKGYIYYRYGRMFFYKGMMQYYTNHDNNEASINFMKAANNFKDSLGFDDDIPIKIDIYNTLGYIYIKIYELNVDRSEPLYEPSEMEDIRANALKYCKISKHETARSLKNWGISYERYNRIDLAIEKYKKAVEKEPEDYQSRICLASAYLKKAQNILDIKNDRNVLLCDMKFKKTQIKESLEYLKYAKFQLKVAYNINSNAANYYYKMGQLFTYCYLIGKENENRKKYSIYAFDNFQIAYSLNPVYNAHRFHERNYFEAVGDIKKAMETNEKLDGTDVQHLNDLYNKKLKISML